MADHFGGTFPGEENSDAFKTFIELIKENRIYVKVSGFERLYHGHAKGMDAIEPIAKAVIQAGPDKIMFGTGKGSSCFTRLIFATDHNRLASYATWRHKKGKDSGTET